MTWQRPSFLTAVFVAMAVFLTPRGQLWKMSLVLLFAVLTMAPPPKPPGPFDPDR